MKNAKFTVGQNVKYPASADGSIPAGTGEVTAAIPSGDNYTYQIKSDATGQVLSPTFKESDLSVA